MGTKGPAGTRGRRRRPRGTERFCARAPQRSPASYSAASGQCRRTVFFRVPPTPSSVENFARVSREGVSKIAGLGSHLQGRCQKFVARFCRPGVNFAGLRVPYKRVPFAPIASQMRSLLPRDVRHLTSYILEPALQSQTFCCGPPRNWYWFRDLTGIGFVT
jgi:hypothetical protein